MADEPNVKRWKLNYMGMTLAPDGDYVLYSDYEALRTAIRQLIAAADALAQAAADCGPLPKPFCVAGLYLAEVADRHRTL